MAADDKDGLLFSLKELKDIAAKEPVAPARAVSRAASPSKKKRKSSILGDASDLLADIQQTVTADAAAEEAARRAAKEAAARAEAEAEAAARAKREAEVAARLAAENARQRAAEEEREARRYEQELAERRARGEYIEEDQPKAVAPAVEAIQTPAQVSAPVPMPRRGAGFFLAVIGLPIVCITAVVLAMILKPEEPAKPEIPLAAAQLPQIAVVEASPPEEVLPVAVAAPTTKAPATDAEADEDVGSTSKKKTRRRRRRSKPKSKAKTEKKDKLKINLGGGGITF